MPIPFTGELAALGTACCWVATALAFESGARRVGSLVVNLMRMPMAFALLCFAAWGMRGVPLPTDATPHHWTWLTLSGLVGFTFGDLCLFRAFVLLGARLPTLIMALVPPFTAVLGWLVLGEVLTGRDLAGMILTLCGVAWAVAERRAPGAGETSYRRPVAGVVLALGGALGQAGGLVISKLGMGDYSALAATQIRVLAGVAGYALLFTGLGWWPRLWAAVADSKAMRSIAVGAFFGPFLGVTLSLVAVQRTVAGVAASIMGTTPVLIIPVVVLSGRERVGPGGVGGAVLAVIGVTLLFL